MTARFFFANLINFSFICVQYIAVNTWKVLMTIIILLVDRYQANRQLDKSLFRYSMFVSLLLPKLGSQRKHKTRIREVTLIGHIVACEAYSEGDVTRHKVLQQFGTFHSKE